MNFKEFLINEMPISRYSLMGMNNWKPNAKRAYGYNAQDIGILTNPKAIAKIHKSWKNSKNNWEFYFSRSSKAWKHIEVGQVSSQWVKENLELDIQPVEDAITIIFTNNRGAEKIEMTSWLIAHRLGHAIRKEDVFKKYFRIESDFKEILKDVYNIDISSMEVRNRNRYYDYGGGYNRPIENTDKYMKALAYAVGTMRSARQWELRNFYEFQYELVAQYIITGKITFNPLPKSLKIDNKMAWGRENPTMKYSIIDDEDFEYWNEVLQNHASTYEQNLDSIFSSLEGKIFVM